MSMAPFRSRWLDFTPGTGKYPTDTTDTTDTRGGVSGVSDPSACPQECAAPVTTEAKAKLARRFVAAEAQLPQAVVDDPARWATWRRFDRLLNEALAVRDLPAAEARVAEAERWAREASIAAVPAPDSPGPRRAVGDMAAEVNVHLTGCRVCRREYFTTDRTAPCCAAGADLKRRYRGARRLALSAGGAA